MPFLSEVIELNDLKGCIYCEPFAGGAGAALKLLYSGLAKKIILNDSDPLIYYFWKAVLNHNAAFIDKIKATPVNISEYKRQKNIAFGTDKRHSNFSKGFAAFYLNRCNRSGILRAGPIGGHDQKGKYKIDARFNKDALIERIQKIGEEKKNISIYNYDALKFLDKFSVLGDSNEKVLFYLDPPYYEKGNELYRKYYSDIDHSIVAFYFYENKNYRWILSYDDSTFIRELFNENIRNEVTLNYFANKAKVGKELIISSKNCLLPGKYKIYSKETSLETIINPA